MVATLLATTDISKPTDENGNTIEQPIHFSTGLSSHPGKFDVVFTPRSEKAQRLLDDFVGDRQ